jgi:hypothetical protein
MELPDAEAIALAEAVAAVIDQVIRGSHTPKVYQLSMCWTR